jgi:hypothetical protein
MKGIIVRAGRVLKYRVVHRAERYGVKHVHGWVEAEKITGASVKEVEQRIAETFAPVVHELSLNRIVEGYHLPENFGDRMRAYLRRDCSIIDRSTGMSVDKERNPVVVVLVTGFVNANQSLR